MIKKKIFFGLFILFFLFILVFFTLSFNSLIGPSKLVVFERPENPNKDLECYPNYPTEPTIILRLDDIESNVYKDIRFQLIDNIVEKNMSVVIGIIPNEIGKDVEVKRYVKEHINNPRFEVALHGYLHSEKEFGYLNEIEASTLLKEGLAKMYDNFGLYPITFIPPYNAYSEGTIQALKENGFKLISAKEHEYMFDGSLFYIGKSTETYDFDNERFVWSDEIVSECKKNLDLRNICVITIHPQDYLDENDLVDQAKYLDFVKMLNDLDNLDVEFKTPKDLIYCQNLNQDL